MRIRLLVLVPAVAISIPLLGCRGDHASVAAPKIAKEPPTGAYAISPSGGVPASGPGERYNHCERIFCLTHKENFFIDHFLTGHLGWVLHDDLRGDVFVPKNRTEGPEFPDAWPTALRLCGQHVHPYVLGRGGGPVRFVGYNATLGYSRAHYASYGTRLDPCCINALGSAYVHARSARGFRFHDLEAYGSGGWQKPFAAREKPSG
jgi:hypothetical protein